jgi:hypothetical protein
MTASTIPAWAYKGTDSTPGVQLYPFTTGNSLPALIVWLILTTNGNDASTLVTNSAAVTQIAQAVNLTEPCVEFILAKYNQDVLPNGVGVPTGSAAEVSAAFQLVIASFHELGVPASYPPTDCPHYTDILKLADSLEDFTPSVGG